LPFNTLLKQLIEKSGLSNKEIAEKCKDHGAQITDSYLSALKNNPDRIPSDEVSRAIALACGADENVLVIEAYLDKAPQEITDMFNNIKEVLVGGMLSGVLNQLDDKQREQARNLIYNMPVAEMIKGYSKINPFEQISMVDSSVVIEQHDDKENYTITNILKDATGFTVPDDSMFPTLPEGSKVIIKPTPPPQLENGDIVYYTKKNAKDYQFRKIFFLNNNKTKLELFPLNSKAKSEAVWLKELTILGKAKQVITDL